MFPVPCFLLIITLPRRTINPSCLFEPWYRNSGRGRGPSAPIPGPGGTTTEGHLNLEPNRYKYRITVQKPQKAPKNAHNSFAVWILQITPMFSGFYSEECAINL